MHSMLRFKGRGRLSKIELDLLKKLYQPETNQLDSADDGTTPLTALNITSENAIAETYKYRECLNIDNQNATSLDILKKLIAYQHFADELLEGDPETFMTGLLDVLNLLKQEFDTKSKELAVFSPLVAYCLVKLGRVLGDLLAFDKGKDILEMTIKLAWEIPVSSQRIVESLAAFLSDVFFSISFDETVDDKLQDIFNYGMTLLMALVPAFDGGNTSWINPDMAQRMLEYLQNDKLRLNVRQTLIELLGRLGHDENIGVLLIDSANLPMIVKFIGDYLRSIPFSCKSERTRDILLSHSESVDVSQAVTIEELDEAPNRMTAGDSDELVVTDFTEATFPEDVPVLKAGEMHIKSIMLQIPDDPPSVASLSSLTVLVRIVSELCHAPTFQPTVITSSNLMKEVIFDPSVKDLDITPFFLASWLKRFVSDAELDVVVDSLHNIGFYEYILETSFIKFENKELMSFCRDLLLAFSNSDDREFYMRDVLAFVLQCVKRLYVPYELVDCVRSCIFIAERAFKLAADNVAFIPKLSRHMMALQKASVATKDPRLLETRARIFTLIDFMSAELKNFEFCLDKLDFCKFLMTSLYDPSTVTFACYQIKRISDVRTPQMTKSWRYIAKFMITQLLSSKRMPISTLSKIITLLITVLKENGRAIWRIFKESRLLPAIVDFAVEMNAKDVVSDIIELLTEYVVNSNDSALDGSIFMKIEPLLSGSVQDYLLNKAFGDDRGMSIPRRIISAAPVSLLFPVFAQKTEEELRDFLSFVSACFEIEKKSCSHELQAVNFTGQLLRYLATFRKEKETSQVFDQVLRLFCELSSFSLKAEDLISFFRLFTTCPGNYRPTFTLKLLKGLLQIMSISQEDSPSQFINMDGNNSQITVSTNVRAGSFHLIFFIELLSGEYHHSSLVEFSNDSQTAAIEMYPEKIVIGGREIPIPELPRNQWFELKLSYHKNVLQVFENKKLILKTECQFGLATDATKVMLLSNIPCNFGWARMELRNSVVFEISAARACGNSIVFRTHIAQFTGKVCQITSVPRDVLREIGGVFVILPLFSQLEQPTIDGHRDEDGGQILAALLQLLKCVLDNEPDHQKDFAKRKGFAMLSVLLSLTSGAVLRNHSMAFFGELFISLDNRQLAIQMIEHLFFNIPFWLSVKDDSEKVVFPALFRYILDFKTKYRTDKDLSKSVNVTNVLYLMRYHLYETSGGRSNVEKTPEELKGIRIQFWEFIHELVAIQFTETDLETLISFCQSRSELAPDSLKCFLRLLKRNVANFVQYFNQYDFSSFVALTMITEPTIFRLVVKVFTQMHKMKLLLERQKVGDWILTFTKYIDSSSSTLETVSYFLKKLPQMPDLGCLAIYMLIFLPAPAKVEQFHAIVRGVQKLPFIVYQPYFLLFLLHLHQDTSMAEFYPVAMQEVAQLIIFDNNSDQLQLFYDFVIVFSAKCEQDFSVFLRDFFVAVLAVLQKNQEVRNEKRNQVYSVVFQFIFEIPRSDPFYYPPFVNLERTQDEKVEFKRLAECMAKLNSDTVPCCYATRTNSKGEWADADLAVRLMNTIFENLSKPNGDINALDYVAVIVGNGVAHQEHCLEFLRPCEEFVFRHAFKSRKVNAAYRKVFVMLTGAVAKAICDGNRDPNLIDYVVKVLENRAALGAELKIKILDEPLDVNDIEGFRKLEFVRVVIETMAKVEEEVSKVIPRERKGMKYSPVEWLHVKTSQFEEREIASEQYITKRRETNLQAKKQYRKLFQSLSIEGGPWSTPEISEELHWRLDNSVFSDFVRNRLKINRKFDTHKEASLTRDLGSYEDAKAVFQAELSKRKMQEFKGDFALMNFGDEEKPLKADSEAITQENVKLKCDVKLNTPKQLHSGTLLLTDRAIFVNTTENVVKIPLSKMKYLFLRRYLVLDTAIEIYTTTMRSYFINFQSAAERRDFLRQLARLKPTSLKFFQKKPEDVKRLAKALLEKWQKGSISNFDFLMKLNIYAGRSYNDLSQYPVMPWVLADYESEELDLTNPQSFRDLTKPMGAMDPGRLELMRERMSNAFTDEEKYLYGALYSSAAVVVGYLIRMEPFTTLHLNLQSGRFDLPDRLFISIPSAWESVCKFQMDFRELIPEFFTLPEFLTNHNKFDLGKLAKGGVVDDVELPRWASSPRHFIDMNRKALESPFVTANLHHWVELIFGINSRPPYSEQCDNIFHPYFYDSALEGDNPPHVVRMVQEYATCFGTVPTQLFDKPISQRMPFVRNTLKVSTIPQGGLRPSDHRVLCVRMHKGLYMTVDDQLRYADVSLTKETKKQLQFALPDMSQFVNKVFCDVSTRFIALSVPWLNSVEIFSKSDGRVESDVHATPITCLEMSEHFCVSGSSDGSVHVVDLHGPIPVTFPVFGKHSQPLSFVRVNENMGVCASISKDGFVRLVSLVDCQCIHGHALSISDPVGFCLSQSGFVVALFNSVDSFIVHVLDPNLNQAYQSEIDGHVESAHAIVVNGIEYLALIRRNNTILFCDIPTLEHKHAFSVQWPTWPTSITFSGEFLLCGFGDGVIARYDVTNLD